MSDNKYGAIYTEDDVKSFIHMAFVAGEEAENSEPTSSGGGMHPCNTEALYDVFKDGIEFKFPQAEPLFVMRAQDRLALGIVRQYLLSCEAHKCDSKHLKIVDKTLRDFEGWREARPETIKKPD